MTQYIKLEELNLSKLVEIDSVAELDEYFNSILIFDEEKCPTCGDTKDWCPTPPTVEELDYDIPSWIDVWYDHQPPMKCSTILTKSRQSYRR